jgi:hypothetical protein
MNASMLLKRIFVLSAAILPLILLVQKWEVTPVFDVIAISIGVLWMIYNIVGYLFDRPMSMGGKIPCSDAQTVYRKCVFAATLLIYGILLTALMMR